GNSLAQWARAASPHHAVVRSRALLFRLLTRRTWSPRGSRHGEPGSESRCGTSGTSGGRPEDGRTAGSGSSAAWRTWACGSQPPFSKSSPRSYLPLSGPKRHPEVLEKSASFLVGTSGGDDGDVHALHLLHLVVVDLGEDDLLAHAQGVVAATVEGPAGHAAEVADPGKRKRDQTLEKLVHPVRAERDHRADRLALTKLEVRDRLARAGEHRPLARDLRELLHGGVEDLRVRQSLAQAHVHDDLLEPRNL